jgi:hypothetical protein
VKWKRKNMNFPGIFLPNLSSYHQLLQLCGGGQCHLVTKPLQKRNKNNYIKNQSKPEQKVIGVVTGCPLVGLERLVVVKVFPPPLVVVKVPPCNRGSGSQPD